ncbi:TetR family transcriptional regulator [Pendulispora brunnea]|uniref:TetR family transcriptional regulator n=1 Tax=Pendulispora brunnea TaxID=2905690 RepID=A0ABZ2K6R4_9BACT
MTIRKKPVISPRREPRQARSEQMVADILEAAIRVLQSDGVERFTMVRLAEVAGVSVGSLYQYFPNRESLFFRLQQASWGETVDRVQEILVDPNATLEQKVAASVSAVFRANEAEGDLRKAMSEAGAPFRDSPEAIAERERGQQRAIAFFRYALPEASESDIVFIADFISTTTEALAERVSDRRLARHETERWAKAAAEMFSLYIKARACSRTDG